MISHFRFPAVCLIVFVLFLASPAAKAQTSTAKSAAPPDQIHELKVTVLSTMLVGDTEGTGEWGFSALVEADGHKVLVDTVSG